MFSTFNTMHKLLKHSKTYYRLCSFSTSIDGVTAEKMGTITAIVINIPEKKNQLNEATFGQLCNEINNFENDTTAAAGVIFGIGGNFCTGCEDNFVPDSKKMIIPRQKPLVAALTGYATGFGFELALLCDLRVIERTAQIGFNALPMKLSDLFYQRLVAIVGLSLALDLTLTGRNMHCKEALQYGLANRLVDCGTGIGQAIQLAKTVGKYPIPILRDVKSSVYSTL